MVTDMELATRADYGAFYTPTQTADYMADLLDVRPGERVLDPCAGGGAFVDALLRRGVAPGDISAWELDANVAASLQTQHPKVRVERRDALLDLVGPNDRFDCIIANPPYLNKASAYVRANRAALRARFSAEIGSGETFAMFLHAALALLRPNGRLVFIVGDTVRTLGTHERLRRLILERHELQLVASTQPRLFGGAVVRTVILKIAKDRRGAPLRVLPRIANEDYNRGSWSEVDRALLVRIDGAPFLFETPPSIAALFEQPLRFGDWVSGHIGMHTRDNHRHLAALEGSHLAKRFAKAANERRVISASEAQAGEWQAYLKQGGEKDFFFPVFEYVDWRPAARATYVIPHGGDFGKAGIAVSGVSRRLSARVMPAGCYWDTNKVMGFVPHQPEDTSYLLGVLNSDLYTFIAKRMLNESSSMQLNDLWKLPIPRADAADHARIASFADQCIALRRASLSADLAAPRRALNEAVYRAFRVADADRAYVERFIEERGLN